MPKVISLLSDSEEEEDRRRQPARIKQEQRDGISQLGKSDLSNERLGEATPEEIEQFLRARSSNVKIGQTEEAAGSLREKSAAESSRVSLTSRVKTETEETQNLAGLGSKEAGLPRPTVKTEARDSLSPAPGASTGQPGPARRRIVDENGQTEDNAFDGDNEEDEDDEAPTRRRRRRPARPGFVDIGNIEDEEGAVAQPPKRRRGEAESDDEDFVNERSASPRQHRRRRARNNDSNNNDDDDPARRQATRDASRTPSRAPEADGDDLIFAGYGSPKAFKPAADWNKDIEEGAEWERKPFAHEIIKTFAPWHNPHPAMAPVFFNRQKFLSNVLGGGCQVVCPSISQEKLEGQKRIFGKVICERYHCEMESWSPHMPAKAGHHGTVYYIAPVQREYGQTPYPVFCRRAPSQWEYCGEYLMTVHRFLPGELERLPETTKRLYSKEIVKDDRRLGGEFENSTWQDVYREIENGRWEWDAVIYECVGFNRELYDALVNELEKQKPELMRIKQEQMSDDSEVEAELP